MPVWQNDSIWYFQSVLLVFIFCCIKFFQRDRIWIQTMKDYTDFLNMPEGFHKCNHQLNVLSTFYEVTYSHCFIISATPTCPPAHTSFVVHTCGSYDSSDSFIWCRDEQGEKDVEREESSVIFSAFGSHYPKHVLGKHMLSMYIIKQEKENKNP